MNLTATERHVIDTLIQVARSAWHLADNTEDNGSESLLVDRESFTALSDALDILAELPDDRPGYVLGDAGKAEWALRRVLLKEAPLKGIYGPEDILPGSSDSPALDLEMEAAVSDGEAYESNPPEEIFTAGIDLPYIRYGKKEMWHSKIECHDSKKKGAEALRDTVLAALLDKVIIKTSSELVVLDEVWSWIEDRLTKPSEGFSPDSPEMMRVYELRAALGVKS